LHSIIAERILITLHAHTREILLFKYKKPRMKLAGHVAGMGEMKNTCRALSRNYEENKPLGGPTSKWKDWNGRAWIGFIL